MGRFAAIIGARKDSSRLAGKNKRLLAGKPLYAHTIESVLEADLFSEVVVTSDDDELLEGCAAYPGVQSEKRDGGLACDRTTMMQVVRDTIERCRGLREGIEGVCIMNPCNPFRGPVHIREAVEIFAGGDADTLVSVTALPLPVEFALYVRDGELVREWQGAARPAEFEKAFYPNGAIIIVRPKPFLEEESFYFGRTLPYEMKWPYCLDIDDPDDLQMAEWVARVLAAEGDG